MRFENTKARTPRPVDSASDRHFCSSRATSLARSRPTRARLTFVKLGAAAAAWTPMMTSTSMSSTSVKPEVAVRGVERTRITLSHIGGCGARVEDGRAATTERSEGQAQGDRRRGAGGGGPGVEAGDGDRRAHHGGHQASAYQAAPDRAAQPVV